MSGSGTTAPGFVSLPVQTPPSLRFAQITRTPNVVRRGKILRPRDNVNSSNGNNIIHFDFPAETMDMREGFLIATITLTTTGGTYKRLAQGSWPWIDYIRVVCGNGYEDRLQFYGRFYSLLWNITVTAAVQSTLGQDVLGLGTQTTRNAFGASSTGTQYVIPIRCGLLNQGFLPLQNLCTPSNGQTMFVEIYIDNPANFIETDGSNPQISITNCRWEYDQLIGDSMQMEGRAADSFVASIQQRISAGTLYLGYKNWAVYQSPVINSSSDITITAKVSSLNAILTTVVDGSTLATTTVNDKYTTWPKVLGSANYSNFQWQINNNWIPFEAIDCTGDALRAFMYLNKFNGVWDSKGINYFAAAVSLDSFNSTQFVLVGDFFSAARNIWRVREQETEVNDLNMFTSGVYPLLRVELTAPPPAFTIAFNFVFYNVLVAIAENGLMRKLQ
jgi:hypothetical protein